MRPRVAVEAIFEIHQVQNWFGVHVSAGSEDFNQQTPGIRSIFKRLFYREKSFELKIHRRVNVIIDVYRRTPDSC